MKKKEQAPYSLAAEGALVSSEPEPFREYSNIAEHMLDGFPQVGTIDDVAAFLQLRPDAVRQMCREGSLRAIKCGNLWRIPREWLAAFIVNGGTEGGVEDDRI